jgi:hypothetical protein
MIDPLMFAELYAECEDPVSICDALGVSFEELDKHRKRQGFPPFKGYRQYTARPKKTIIRREPEEVKISCYECKDRRVANCINCDRSYNRNRYMEMTVNVEKYDVTIFELVISKVLLEANYRLSTRQVAKLANLSWNTAHKYLNQLWCRHWISKYAVGNRYFWRAYASK